MLAWNPNCSRSLFVRENLMATLAPVGLALPPCAGAAREEQARRATLLALAVEAKNEPTGEISMARRYSKGASKDVERAMRKRKRGTLKRGKGGRGGKVKSRKQAIAIGLSEARRKGKKVPRKSRRKK